MGADMSSFLSIVLATCAVLYMKSTGLSAVHDPKDGSIKDIDISVVGVVPAGHPEFALPQLSLLNGPGALESLLIQGFGTSVITFILVIGSATPFAIVHDYNIDANQELLALGCANVVGSCFGAMCIAGSGSRTAVGNDAGQTSPVAVVIASIIALLALELITGWFFYI